MRLVRFSRIGMLALSAVLAAGVAAAKDGRDFVGQFSFAHVSQHGGQVEGTLALRLFNYSGADLRQASIMVHPAHPAEPAAIAPIRLWPDGRSIVVSRPLTIPRGEFERWSRTQPEVFIEYRDAQGRTWRRSVQLRRRPLLPSAEVHAGGEN
jgi:hypothetical protein